MEELNILEANFTTGTCNAKVYTRPVWQWSYGQILKINGLDLPFSYEVHFSNEELTGQTITMIGDEDGVAIPDQFISSDDEVIYAWLFLHEGEDDGETVSEIIIQKKLRPEPSNEAPTPEEQSVITQTIAALDAAVEEAQAAVEAIQDMGVDAESLPEGSSATVEKTVDPDTGVVTLSFGIPVGATGATGATGPQGIQGEKGDKGDTGAVPIFTVGSTTTLPPGSAPSINIDSTDPENPVMEFGIPKGDTGAKGDKGDKGDTGDTGPAPSFAVGTTSSLPAGSAPVITIDSSDPAHLVMDFGIPAGAKGDKGDTGEISEDEFYLHIEEIPDTVQEYTFTDGNVTQIEHSRNGSAVRTDTFDYSVANQITETRTLDSGDVLEIVTNLLTLETIVTYTEAV